MIRRLLGGVSAANGAALANRAMSLHAANVSVVSADVVSC
jgi:hypothetical protein